MKNRNPDLDYQAIYDIVHTSYPNYGSSPTRLFEFTVMTHSLTFSSMLDVGCGQAQLLKWIHDKDPKVQLHGIDISQIALNKIPKTKAILKQGKAQEIPFPDNQFDLVICSDVLEHLPQDDVQKAIGELRRVATAHVWIQTEDADCSEDKYLVGTKYADVELHATRRRWYWWKRTITNHRLRIINEQRFGSKISLLCHV